MAEPSKVKGAVGTRNPDAEKPAERKGLSQAEKDARDRAKHDIDSKMTPEQLRSVRAFEEKHKNFKTERVAMIDSKGKVVAQSTSGSRNRTVLKTNPFTDYSDTIITHNHPDEEGFGAKGIARSVGISFSSNDLKSVANKNAKGIRARANGYTFFLGRKGDSYPVDGDTLYREWQKEFNKHVKGYTRADGSRYKGDEEYIREKASEYYAASTREGKQKAYDEALQRNARMNAVASHAASRAVAKKYGLIYTRKKN